MADINGTPPPAPPTSEMPRNKIKNFPTESIKSLKPDGYSVRTYLLQIGDLAEAYTVDDLLKSLPPIADANKNKQSKGLVFLFKSTMHGSFYATDTFTYPRTQCFRLRQLQCTKILFTSLSWPIILLGTLTQFQLFLSSSWLTLITTRP